MLDKNIHRIEYIDDKGNYNMILEYANEGTLREYLKTNFTILQWTDKLRIAKEIALGLLFLHDKNIIHRDLHSKNVLIHHGQPKITDFGLSKQINEITSSSNSILIGMPEYIEPQCLIKHGYKRDKRSDVYSFGQILWEISSGRPPFQAFESAFTLVHIFQGNREEPIEVHTSFDSLSAVLFENITFYNLIKEVKIMSRL
ncbi:kinase-like protein [Gigaspora margarita]|uniref:Kinase-like protein n=1 Tax=Gigaspora margarita TaxID=4874 RepID=A0A8H4A6A9_GIGMA|nr:kinase-like protein [Gigaspora margarita]